MQSSGGLCDVATGARAVHPDARVGSGGRRRRRRDVCAERSALRRPDLLRHGRHDGESVRAAGRRRGALEPITSSAATTKVWRSAFRCSTSRKSAPAAAASPGRRSRRLARRPGKRRREPGPGVLRPRRHAADRHRRASRARPSRARTFPRRRDAARRDGAPSARSARTIAEPLGLDVAAGGRRHRRDRDDADGQRVRAVTTERGLDPRDFALVAYGGAGPLHAVDVARELAIRDVVIPRCAGAFLGLRHADVADLRREYARTLFAPLPMPRRLRRHRRAILRRRCEERRRG